MSLIESIGRYEAETQTVHFELACPSCAAPIHVVAALDSNVSRWCCPECLTVGRAPLSVEAARIAQQGALPRPVAKA